MSFGNKWVKPQGESVGHKLIEGIKPQTPLKPRIEEAQKKLQMQIQKLDAINSRINEKDQVIFKRVVLAMQSHDAQHARVLSGELSQIRKMGKMISSAKLALEQIQLRLNTITELGDVVVTLSPAMSVIKGLQGGLSGMMPEADQSFAQISDLLGNIMTDSGQIPSAEIGGYTAVNDDTARIMEEASAIVEMNMKSKFPDLPSTSSSQRSAAEASGY
ncbi:Snf7 family protein [Nitrososphaera viennensis]|uniref:SNF7-domain-containing protein n=2 Tax=Nitrososphaera viennensis TaxID=1034015 RepID=A0A060HN76_9ARCH|nr:Snf7 family protein [Nitrososphaera viennensis]AIC14677.1 SNF7-domain-containing protein [Nitrososphaera viennensis EN76]UVS69640.1 Snf7 family protein [Nitrososphaera viennensis]